MYKTLLNRDDFTEFCKANNIHITHRSDMSTKIRGFCICQSLNYYVFLNSKHSFSQLQLTLMHELVHVFENHFMAVDNARQCEHEAHIIVNELKKELFIY